MANYMNTYSTNPFTDGDATTFRTIFKGVPVNSEGTPDPRSSVYIDGVQQAPMCGTTSLSTWTWRIDTGSNLSCNLNVSLGNVAI